MSEQQRETVCRGKRDEGAGKGWAVLVEVAVFVRTSVCVHACAHTNLTYHRALPLTAGSLLC